jgi:hypothetical protein
MLHREVEGFEALLRAVKTYFDTQPEFRRHPREHQHIQSMKSHIKFCEERANELLQKLPEAQNEDRSVWLQALTQFKQLLKSSAISKLLNDIASLKATLELWLQIFQL